MMKSISELLVDRYGVEVDFGSEIESSDILRKILGRGSQRHFTDKPVTVSMLKTLLGCAQSAPTKSDLQQYSVIVVTEKSRLVKLGKLNSGLTWPTNATVFMVWCADMRRNQKLAKLRGYKHQNNNLDTFMNGVVDAALAMQSFICAAEGVGLGCCPISQIRNDLSSVTKILSIPSGVFPIAGLALGWPKYQKPRVSMRLPQDVVAHWDKYSDEHLASLVNAYDKRRHEREPIAPEKQRHVDIYGVNEFCSWSENVTRQLSLPERPGFSDFLRKHGYELD